jgi:hypothetical protein
MSRVGWWCAGSPDFNADKHRAAGQDTLFDVWRFHAFFTTADPTVLDTVAADKTHRQHAVIEQVHADLKNSALAHLPSGVCTANAAWLVLAVIAFNLTRAAGTLAAPDLAKATTATLRRKLITVPTRVATSARRITLHPRRPGPGQPPGQQCSAGSAIRRRAWRPDHPSSHRCASQHRRETPGQRGPAGPQCPQSLTRAKRGTPARHHAHRWIEAKAVDRPDGLRNSSVIDPGGPAPPGARRC